MRADPAGAPGQTVQRDHAGPAQADVVLQRQTGPIDLPLLSLAAQLLGQFVALRQARRARAGAPWTADRPTDW